MRMPTPTNAAIVAPATIASFCPFWGLAVGEGTCIESELLGSRDDAESNVAEVLVPKEDNLFSPSVFVKPRSRMANELEGGSVSAVVAALALSFTVFLSYIIASWVD
jgi:hypothetical protein